MTVVETDSRSRVVLPGHPNQRFVAQDNEDGSILLQPARVVTEAQLEYDNDPELQALLERAAGSSTVTRARRRRSWVTTEGSYSDVANEQLDELERGEDSDLHNAVLDVCELIFLMPDLAQSMSTAISTAPGIRLRLPVRGHAPYKVFWSSDGPLIEAVFPYT
jgi:hypothetical protein